MDLLRTHGFIHIPKTGGSTIELFLNESQAVIKRRHRWSARHRLSACPPWHLPPDLYEARYNRTYLRPTFCVVREPRERLQSSMDWKVFGKLETPPGDLGTVFRGGRSEVEWTEERAHRMPQSWFVWDEDGRVLCDCVVAFEKLKHITNLTINRSSPRNRSFAFPRRLYDMDALLHEVARSTPALCYHPRPLYGGGLAQEHRGPVAR